MKDILFKVLMLKGDAGEPTDEQTQSAVDEYMQAHPEAAIDETIINSAVDDWLDAHPEATTSVLDGSLTAAKFTNDLKLKTIKDYVTPEMFGAVGDGTTDDTTAITDCFSAGLPVFVKAKYKISSNVSINSNMFGDGIILATYNATSKPKSITFADGCDVIEGVTFEGLSLYCSSHTHDFVMRNCKVLNYGNGISLLSGTYQNVFISNNEFIDQIAFLSANASAFGIFGAISIEQSSVSGDCLIKNNLIDGTMAFGIIFYNSSFSTDYIVENNTIRNTGANRDINDTNFSGCGGIYRASNSNYADGQILNNTLININEVGIEGRYNIVSGNYIENTGAFYYKYPIADNAGIYGYNRKVIGNTIVGASGNAAIHQTANNGNLRETGMIAGNILIDYPVRKASTPYEIGDYVRINASIYVATTAGTTSSTDITDGNNTITDGSVTWEYRKRLARCGIELQNGVGIVLGNNTIQNFQAAYNQIGMRSAICMNDSIVNCDVLSYTGVGYPYRTIGTVIFEEDYAINPTSKFGTITDGVLTVTNAGFDLISALATGQYKWVNVSIFGEFTGTCVLTYDGAWKAYSVAGSNFISTSNAGGKKFGLYTNGTMDISRILITAGE